MMGRKSAPRDEVLEALLKFRRNHKWALEHSDKLRKYLDRFVAIDDGRILDVSDDEDEIYRKYGKSHGVYIHYVWPPDLVWMV
ncbi:MAG TPA: DUF5678 domain-containing protein [Candidatus Thermoplasmatota archaeon]|nr:DUF5678 domain-containing protein [Candidatus Thermoplasmatota archaeon]